MSDYSISAEGVTVKYGDFSALENFNFSAQTGKIVALLGPNGAGKSTFVDTIIGARRVSGGRIRTLGVDPVVDAKKLRPNIGIVLQSAGFPTGMKVKDILFSWRHYTPSMTKKDVCSIAERVNLSYAMNRPLSSLSGGEKRRVDIAIALYGKPKLIVLDEPTTGLDPISRENIWDIIRQQRDQGSTVLLTTHYLDEIEALSDSVSVIKEGHIIASGTADELAKSVSAPRLISIVSNPEALATILRMLPPDSDSICRNGGLEWQSNDPAHDLSTIYHACFDKQWKITDICVEKPSLRAAYVTLVGQDCNISSIKDENR